MYSTTSPPLSPSPRHHRTFSPPPPLPRDCSSPDLIFPMSPITNSPSLSRTYNHSIVRGPSKGYFVRPASPLRRPNGIGLLANGLAYTVPRFTPPVPQPPSLLRQTSQSITTPHRRAWGDPYDHPPPPSHSRNPSLPQLPPITNINITHTAPIPIPHPPELYRVPPNSYASVSTVTMMDSEGLGVGKRTLKSRWSACTSENEISPAFKYDAFLSASTSTTDAEGDEEERFGDEEGMVKHWGCERGRSRRL